MRKIFQILSVLGLFVLALYLAYNKNWTMFSVLILASIGIFQEPIKRWWNKPILVFAYKEIVPFRTENLQILYPGPQLLQRVTGTYECFMVENNGRGSALQCRCQIREVKQNGKSFGCYRGYPLHWARRPDADIDPLKAERINIGAGESEFIDLCYTASSNQNINLQKYHKVPIGIPDSIPPGIYEVELIFSGDNFRPYFLVFTINKENSIDINGIKVNLLKYWQE